METNKTSTQLVPIHDAQRMFQILFHESAAGIQVSGDSGSGKSVALAGIVQSLVGTIGGLLIDPHGDLSRLVYSLCMKMGPRVSDRVVYVRHSDTSHVPIINPLAMPDDDADSLIWGGMLTAKVEHFINILLAAWGEFDLNGKTILQRNLYRIFSCLADARLPVAASRMFLDTDDPLYRTMLRLLPDVAAQRQMESLIKMRPIDRESQLGSTRNRVLGLLQNPVIATTFGKTKDAFDFNQLYDQGQDCHCQLGTWWRTS